LIDINTDKTTAAIPYSFRDKARHAAYHKQLKKIDVYRILAVFTFADGAFFTVTAPYFTSDS
jgi:hypothetical protein